MKKIHRNPALVLICIVILFILPEITSASWKIDTSASEYLPGKYSTIAVESSEGPHINYQNAAFDDFMSPSAATEDTPTPDINVNGFENLNIYQGDYLSVTIQLNAGSMNGHDADWWVIAMTPLDPPEDWYYFDLHSGWMPGITVTYQGPLFDLSPYEVLHTRGLPLGNYTVYFGVDMNMNGSLDMGQAYYDYVTVYITSIILQ